MGGIIGLFGGGGETVIRGEKIGDFQINTASYGEVVPDVLGTTRVAGNVIYYDDFTSHEHRTSQRAGKGGGGHTTTQISYTYTVAVAIALSEGPIAGIGRVWKDKEVLQYPQSDIMLSLFDGRFGQAPWGYVQSRHPDKALPYSGLAYMAGVVDLGSQASLPNYNFEVRGKLLNTGDGIDVNPADYIAYVLAGVGIKDTAIEGLENYRKYCANADLLISSPPDAKEKKAQEIVNEIAEFTNAFVFWSNDRLKIVPLADNPVGAWAPDMEIKYDLTVDDFLPQSDGTLIQYKRKDSSECYNQATVEFLNRDNGYEKEAVSFDVVADIQVNGLRPAPMKTIHYLYTKRRAAYVAEQLAMRQLYLKNQYTFKLDWAFCRLEPGDLLTITDEASMLDRRVIVVTDVQEAVDGELTITAVGKPPGAYTPARYDVHEVDRPFIDFNAEPPSVDNVTILQPPGDISGNELFIGVTAKDGWGGCNVWISDSGDSYKLAGSISRQARIGELISAMSETATSCTIRLYNGTLKSGTPLDAERGNTLCWIGGECFSYETATLQPNGLYVLSGIVRGQYGTSPRTHSAGTRFSRLDESFFRGKYRQEDVGKRLYFKFTSVNTFGGNEQSLADVSPVEYQVQAYYIPEISNYSLFTRYHDLGRGVKAYDVVAQYTPPPISTFDTAEAYYREGDGQWKYAGTGTGQIIISGLELGHTYEVRVAVKDIHGNYSQGVVKSIAVTMKAEVPNAPEGFSVRFGDRAYFSWLEVTNADIDYYEVRMDKNPGVSNGQIARSNNTTADGILQSRTGTLYLYAHNPVKGYSAPAIVTYNVPAPTAPSNIYITNQITGLAISFSAIPGNCLYANLYVDEKVYQMNSNSFLLPLDAGVYRIRISYVDMFGEGARSAERLATVKATIPKELINLEELGINTMDKAIEALKQEQGTIKTDVSGIQTKLTQATSGFTQSVTDLKKDWESRFTQISEGFDFRITESLENLDGDNLIARLNLSKSGVRIDGKLFHVTGATLFDDNIVTNKMLQANAVTADKISVNTLSAICATIGTLRTRTSGARTEIKDNLIEVYDANNRLRVRMGIW